MSSGAPARSAASRGRGNPRLSGAPGLRQGLARGNTQRQLPGAVTQDLSRCDSKLRIAPLLNVQSVSCN